MFLNPKKNTIGELYAWTYPASGLVQLRSTGFSA